MAPKLTREAGSTVGDLNLSKVTVVICNYNYEKYVSEAILSAKCQTYSPVQIIVVDDGSTDGSLTEIYRHADIHVIEKPNGGQTSGIRAAIPHIVGDIVILLDSDDFLLPDACKSVAEAWSGDLTMVQYRLIKMDNDGAFLGYYPDRDFLYGNEKAFVLQYGWIPSSPTSGNAFARHHLFNAFQHNNHRDRAYTDGYLIYTAPLFGHVKSLDRVLGVYRVHGENASLSAGRSLRRLKNQFRTNAWHAQGVSDAIVRLGIRGRDWSYYLAPFNWRNAIFIKKLDPTSLETADFSMRKLVYRAVISYINSPFASLAGKTFNIVGAMSIWLGPRWLARQFISESSSEAGPQLGR